MRATTRPISGSCAHESDQADHERLAAALRQTKGKWLLSYNDHPEIRKLYDWATGIDEVSVRYSINRKRQGQPPAPELLIRNYEVG